MSLRKLFLIAISFSLLAYYCFKPYNPDSVTSTGDNSENGSDARESNDSVVAKNGANSRRMANRNSPEDAVIEQQHSQQRIDGLTTDEMTVLVSQSATDGHVVDHARFLWRATELLRTNPGACAALATIYENGDSPSGRRTLIADLLAHAGSPAAQSTLVNLLKNKVTTSDPSQVDLWQRLSFVEEPTAETVQAASERFKGVSGDERLAMTHTLGSLAGHLRDSGDTEAADSLHRFLEQGYGSAAGENERVAALAGLGNSRDEKDVPVFVQALSSDSTSVRGAAIRALGRQPSSLVARTAMVTVLSKPELEPEVAATAVRSLGKRPLSNPEFDALAGVASAPQLENPVAEALSSTLTKQMAMQNSPSWRGAVEALGSRATGPVAVQAQGLLFLDDLQKSADLGQ